MSSQPYMAYTADDGADTQFRWHGGAYIEIGLTDSGEWQALDVINVWNYATDTPRIPRTLDAFAERCEQWIAERELDD